MQGVNKATTKELLIRWLIVIWLLGLLLGSILISEPGSVNVLTMPIAMISTVSLLHLEMIGLRLLSCRFESKRWGIIFLILFSLHFSVVFFFLNKLVFISLVILAGRLILTFVGSFPVTRVIVHYTDQYMNKQTFESIYVADEKTAKQKAINEIKNQNPDLEIIES